MELKIYKQDATLKITISPSSSSMHNHELMKENVLSIGFTSPTYVALDVNDYITLQGTTYKLRERYAPK